MRSKWINRVLSVALLFTTLTTSVSYTFTTAYAEEAGASTQQSAQSGVSWPEAPEISAGNGILIDADTGAILYEKNAYTKCYPASTTKILTGLLTVENCSMDETVTFSRAAANSVTWEDSNLATKVGEQYTVEQALYGLLLYSANEIAYGLAEHVGGSLENFVEMMNARATELGCTNTVFTNPTGLPDENQHTTAHDMALIMKAAADNESFQTIASTTSYTIPATNVSGGERVLTNNFSMLTNTNAAYYQYCTGGREGYTEASGSTLVCSAQKNGITLIAVVLQGTSGTTATEAASLLNYGFDNFNMLSLGDNDFNMLSGGDVYVPVGTTADALTTQDGEVQDGQYSRQYLFGGTAVGTSVMVATQEEDTSLVDASVQNIDAAKNYTEGRNNLPYFIIGGVGILLLLLILLRIIKVAKS